jgi:hypothetical protein
MGFVADRSDHDDSLGLGAPGNGESARDGKALNAYGKLQPASHDAFLSPGFSFKNSAFLEGIDFHLHPAN